MSRSELLRLLLALASGALLVLGFAPFDLPILPWFCPALLILGAWQTRRRIAFLCGFLHGAAFFVLSVPWIYTVMRVHGNLPPAAAAGVLALMVAVLALFPAFFAWGVCWLSHRRIARALFAAPFLWVALELARTHMPIFGFPWNALGYAASRHLGLAQLTVWTGIYGLSFFVAAYNAVLAWLLLTRSGRAWIAWLVTTASVAPAVVVGHHFLPDAEPQHVAHLVQTNFPQSLTYDGDWFERHSAELGELEQSSIRAARGKPGPIIWPEVPAPFSLQESNFARRAQRIPADSGSFFLVGVVEWKAEPDPEQGETRPEPFNSVVLLEPSGRRAFAYDKIHLVPFGEYVPLRRWLKFAESLTAGIGDFHTGHDYGVGQLPGGRFGVFICYEAIFPNEVRQFTKNGAELLVNLSNDGWFGRSAAPDQHVAMARVRAIENRRWLLRATNNGHTVVVDPYGRERARLAPDVRGVLEAPFAFRSDLTLYARFGDWWAWVSVIMTALLMATARKRGREARKQGSKEAGSR